MEQLLQQTLGAFGEQNAWIFFLIALWSIPWKGVALWKSSRRNEKWWFIALLVVNTVGILEILYIFIFSKRKEMARGIAEEKKDL